MQPWWARKRRTKNPLNFGKGFLGPIGLQSEGYIAVDRVEELGGPLHDEVTGVISDEINNVEVGIKMAGDVAGVQSPVEFGFGDIESTIFVSQKF